MKTQLKKTSITVFVVIFSAILFLALVGSAQSRRDKRDQPEKLMDIAGVKPGMSIGEAGAGRGYLTFHQKIIIDFCAYMFYFVRDIIS